MAGMPLQRLPNPPESGRFHSHFNHSGVLWKRAFRLVCLPDGKSGLYLTPSQHAHPQQLLTS